MKPHIYKLTCLTNLHVGNGDVNYSIIDNEVERDPVLGEPIIPSSGVKGALLAFMREKGYAGKPEKQEKVEFVFGGKDKNGKYKFLSAGLLARPVRVTKGSGAYLLATSPELLQEFKKLCIEIGTSDVDRIIGSIPELKDNKGITNSDAEEIEIGSLETSDSYKFLNNLFVSEPWCVIPHDKLREIALPVTARNVLKETGESKNLWYEEYVPHHSVFYMIILTPDNKNYFDDELKINDEIVQFGADASIGYGLIRIEKIKLDEVQGGNNE